MESREKPHIDNYKKITSTWNYASCTLSSLLFGTWNILSARFLLYRAYITSL